MFDKVRRFVARRALMLIPPALLALSGRVVAFVFVYGVEPAHKAKVKAMVRQCLTR